MELLDSRPIDNDETVAIIPSNEIATSSLPSPSNVNQNQNNGHLIIASVVLENFKSYGGRHVIGPFHRRFSSIVGPNGSGKSNIIDAMLFVFGRRAQQLRHKKLSDLIHRSASLPDLEFARVAVHFQNIVDDPSSETGYQSLPDSSFVVCREAFIDGTSRYSIDGRTAMQKDAVQLLKSRGVDLDHNRFLILQGEVEQIAMMKPKGQSPNEEGLIEYLEDIIGSNQFLPKIEEAKAELEKIAEVVQEQREKMQSAKTNVESMKGPVQLAEQLCESERRLITLKTQLELKSGRGASHDLEKAQAAYDEVKTKWSQWKTDRNNDQKEIAELESAFKTQRDVVIKAEKLLKASDGEFSELERRDNELMASQTHCERRAQTLQKEASKLETERIKCEALSKELKVKAQSLSKQVPELQNKVETLTGELDILEQTLQNEFDAIRKHKEKADRELQPEVVKLGEMKASVEVMKTKARLIEEKQQIAFQEQQNIQEKLKTSQDLLTEKKLRLEENQKTTEKLKKSFAKKQAEVISFREEFIKRRDEFHLQRQQLEAKEASLKESRSDSMLIPKILQAKEDGSLHGVVDRLWNLGIVDQNLEGAFSAVASSEVLVVERTPDAQAVVEFVRKGQLGRVTCIVLDRVRSELSNELKGLRKKSIPSGAKLLLDLVDISNVDHEIAFYFVLRDTLLVPTLDEARKIAFDGAQRWRVVTLDGQVIDRSGTMTGGLAASQSGSLFKQRKGAVGVTETRDIERLKVAIAEKEGQLNVLKDKKSRSEAEIADLDQQLNELEATRRRLSAEADSAKQDVEHYKKVFTSSEIPKLTEQEKLELKNLGQQYDKCEIEIRQQQEEVDSKQQQVDKITKAIEAVGGGKRKKLRGDVETLTADLEHLKKELKDAEIQSEVNRKRADKLETLIPEKRAEAEVELETSRSHGKEKDEITDKAEVVLRKKDDIEAILKEQRIIEKEKSIALKERQSESKKFGLREVEFQTTLQDLEHSLSASKSLVKKHQKQIKKFELEWETIPYISDLDFEKIKFPDFQIDSTEESDKNPALQVEYTDAQLDELDKVLIECEIKKITESMASIKVDLSILDKYRAALTKLKEKTAEFEDICQQRESKVKELDHLQFIRLKQFSSGFVIIAAGVKELYQMITQEGDAELELVDPSNPFAGGIVFSVRPPKKSWKRIQNLSGGEKTLSSLALVFALHQFRPTPIYFLDEIDAALDHRNVSTIALYVANQAKDAQFIIISLRNHMFELADRLVGIYKTHGITKTATIDPDDFVEVGEKGAIHDLDNVERLSLENS